MKLIISKATVLSLNTQAADLVELVTGESHHNDATFFDIATREGATQYANHSVTLVNGEYVLEVNDGGMFKYMAVYLKVARVIQPFVKPVMGLMAMLKSDIADIERFFYQEK